MRTPTLALLLAAALATGAAQAQSTGADPGVALEDTVVVRGRADDLIGISASASEGRIGQRDFGLRPLLREGELLETVPGLIATQHSGDGKSNQLFLRGFNLDHGTDFRTEVEGMPVNMPTHGHGQGYIDVNFVIPELVSHVAFEKGGYDAAAGDFAAAGAARVHLVERLDRGFFQAQAGADRYRRAVGAGSQRVGPGELLVGAELKNYDGPWQRAQNLEKVAGLARYRIERGRSELSFLAMGYDNRWDASDQIPLRAVSNGLIDRFGQVDETLGGSSSRYSVSADWSRTSGATRNAANVYVIDYELDLFSNFTYFLDDTTSGDQFEQVDERIVIGGAFQQRRRLALFDRPHVLTAGIETRLDLIQDVGLYRTRDRERTATVRNDEVTESATGVHLSLETQWTRALRTELGARADLYAFDVEALSHPENGGSESAGIVSPKASMAYAFSRGIEAYLNGGLGFHSNDARGTTIAVDPVSGDPVDPVDPLVRARGAEIGVRLSPTDGSHSTISAWTLALDSELLFVGDAGTTEPTGRTRRAGVEIANFFRVARGLTCELDVSLSRARQVDEPEGADHIPGALERVVTAGVTWSRGTGPFAAARVRHFGAYPLVEDDSVRAEETTLASLGVGWRLAGVELAVEAINVFDEAARDIQYYYASRLEGEAPAGVEDVHFHPAEPRQLRTRVRFTF